jgi:hypothetical protein
MLVVELNEFFKVSDFRTLKTVAELLNNRVKFVDLMNLLVHIIFSIVGYLQATPRLMRSLCFKEDASGGDAGYSTCKPLSRSLDTTCSYLVFYFCIKTKSLWPSWEQTHDRLRLPLVFPPSSPAKLNNSNSQAFPAFRHGTYIAISRKIRPCLRGRLSNKSVSQSSVELNLSTD